MADVMLIQMVKNKNPDMANFSFTSFTVFVNDLRDIENIRRQYLERI